MTSPRPVVPGAVYLVMRRCSERRFFLRPSKLTNQTFLYLLALAAKRYRVMVHAFCVLSNHVHMVVTDPHAQLPVFHQFLDALVARALIASLGRSDGGMPEKVTLRLTVPAGFESAAQFRKELVRALGEREAEARKQHRARGGFLGISKVLRQKPTARPKPGEPRRGLNPRVAGRDQWKRIEALGRLVEFLRAYREAWLARRAGKRKVEFPFGTYELRVRHGVLCAGSA